MVIRGRLMAEPRCGGRAIRERFDPKSFVVPPSTLGSRRNSLDQARFDSWTDLGLPVSIDFLPVLTGFFHVLFYITRREGRNALPPQTNTQRIQGIVVSSPGKKTKKPQKICTWIRDRFPLTVSASRPRQGKRT